ncbi:MAG: HAMP domain-containing histidine kinase [Lachnospiraceae bacterium]|nr:HAMP domain-containing histidine kinase [Lachnospiraceae bacterium]
MFQKLHLQMTLFCTTVTSCILLVLTLVCFFFAQNSLKKNDYNSFLTQLNAFLIHLQEQDTISHQWLNQLQGNGEIYFFLYDNKKPLSYQSYHFSKKESRLAKEAANIARKKYDVDIFSTDTHKIIVQAEFNFSPSTGTNYYASAGIIPKKSGTISFIILFSLEKQQKVLKNLRIIVCLAALAAIFLLFIFSWYFTKRIIIPLEESQKQQTLFIASASHELRAPLAVLRSGLEVLKNKITPAEQAHFIDLMTEESSHMQNLVNHMLLLANADSGHLPINPSAYQPDGILINIYEKYETLANKKNIVLFIDLPDELLPNCLCDIERITQVFTILMDNALSYTPAGGSIRLSLTLEPMHPHGECLLFCFADTGCGVPETDKKLIFERFYRSEQVHTDKEHFGLGLCIAKEIVRAHKGNIWVEDHNGGGSCFYVRLPAVFT